MTTPRTMVRGWLLARRLRPHLDYLTRHRRGEPIHHPDPAWPAHMTAVLRAISQHTPATLAASERRLHGDHRGALRRLAAAYHQPTTTTPGGTPMPGVRGFGTVNYYASSDSAGMAWASADADFECVHGELPGECDTLGCENAHPLSQSPQYRPGH